MLYLKKLKCVLLAIFLSLSWLAACGAPSPTPEPTPPALTPTPAAPGGKLFALLADNTLLTLDPKVGTILNRVKVGTTPPPLDYRLAGYYFARGKEGKTLYLLVPGWSDEPDKVVALDSTSGQILNTFTLPDSVGRLSAAQPSTSVYHVLTVGAKTGRLYLVGIRGGNLILTVLDPANGSLLKTWTLVARNGVSWVAYKARLADDEQSLWLSYHNYDSQGTDYFRLAADESTWEKCFPRFGRNNGCFLSHGTFDFWEDSVVMAQGEPILYGYAASEGAVFSQSATPSGLPKFGYDSGLAGSHILEFVLDHPAKKLYAIGGCQGTDINRAGFSALDLTKPGVLEQAAALSKGVTWKTLPAPPLVKVQMPDLCAERLIQIAPDSLALAKTVNTADFINSKLAGRITTLNPATGQIQTAIDVTPPPLDIFYQG